MKHKTRQTNPFTFGHPAQNLPHRNYLCYPCPPLRRGSHLHYTHEGTRSLVNRTPCGESRKFPGKLLVNVKVPCSILVWVTFQSPSLSSPPHTNYHISQFIHPSHLTTPLSATYLPSAVSTAVVISHTASVTEATATTVVRLIVAPSEMSSSR